MKNIRLLVTLGVMAIALQSCVVPDADRGGDYGRDRDDRLVSCGREHRLYVADLDISPDPIAQGERIRAWRVRLRADASGECQTTLRIRERSDGGLVGQTRVYSLRPGWNDISFEPLESYRFHRSEHCFDVVADIAGTGRAVDAERTFCARQISGNRWTLR